MFKVALTHEVAAGPLYKNIKNSIKCDKITYEFDP